MNRVKRFITIMAIIIATMLIVPLITIHTVKADAGMLVTMLLFFIVHPIVSIVVGMLAGRDIQFFWFSPILVAGFFWVFSCLAYAPAFPVVYAAIYLVISAISMLITWFVTKKQNAEMPIFRGNN